MRNKMVIFEDRIAGRLPKTLVGGLSGKNTRRTEFALAVRCSYPILKGENKRVGRVEVWFSRNRRNRRILREDFALWKEIPEYDVDIDYHDAKGIWRMHVVLFKSVRDDRIKEYMDRLRRKAEELGYSVKEVTSFGRFTR